MAAFIGARGHVYRELKKLHVRLYQKRTVRTEPEGHIRCKLSYISPDNHKIEKFDDKQEKYKVEFGSEKQASRIFRLRKIDVFNMIFNMENSKKLNVSEKRPKIAKNIF